ncbi:hypothetical protein BDW62DRAFT_179558 [Aspergillus aurantiobrunneus]
MPTCWAVFQKPSWGAQYLERLGGSHVRGNEAAYMLWLGEVQEVYGEPGSKAVEVADFVLHQIDGLNRP